MGYVNFEKRAERLSHYRNLMVEILSRHIVGRERASVTEMLDLLLAQATDHGRLSGLEVAGLIIDDAAAATESLRSDSEPDPVSSVPLEQHRTHSSAAEPSERDNSPVHQPAGMKHEDGQTKSGAPRVGRLLKGSSYLLAFVGLLILAISLTMKITHVHFDPRPILFYLTHSESSSCSDLPPDLRPLYEKCR